MRSIWFFLSGIGLGVLFSGIAYSYHFVMTKEGFVVVSKPQANLKDIYADIREWTLSDWGDHADLARALVADGRSDLVGQSLTENTLNKWLPPISKDQSAGKPLESLRQ